MPSEPSIKELITQMRTHHRKLNCLQLPVFNASLQPIITKFTGLANASLLTRQYFLESPDDISHCIVSLCTPPLTCPDHPIRESAHPDSCTAFHSPFGVRDINTHANHSSSKRYDGLACPSALQVTTNLTSTWNRPFHNASHRTSLLHTPFDGLPATNDKDDHLYHRHVNLFTPRRTEQMETCRKVSHVNRLNPFLTHHDKGNNILMDLSPLRSLAAENTLNGRTVPCTIRSAYQISLTQPLQKLTTMPNRRVSGPPAFRIYEDPPRRNTNSELSRTRRRLRCTKWLKSWASTTASSSLSRPADIQPPRHDARNLSFPDPRRHGRIISHSARTRIRQAVRIANLLTTRVPDYPKENDRFLAWNLTS